MYLSVLKHLLKAVDYRPYNNLEIDCVYCRAHYNPRR